MKNLNELYDLIECEKIIIDETWTNNTGINGIYISIPNSCPIIGINKSICNDFRKLRCTICEELGHHFTTGANLTKESESYYEKLLKEKEEMKAKTWGADFLISDDEFLEALLKCISNKYELCEHFCITNEALEYKLHSILENEERYKNILNSIKMNEIAYYNCNI